MTHVRVCECCGKNLEIHDDDHLETVSTQQDHKHDIALCEQCIGSQPSDDI